MTVTRNGHAFTGDVKRFPHWKLGVLSSAAPKKATVLGHLILFLPLKTKVRGRDVRVKSPTMLFNSGSPSFGTAGTAAATRQSKVNTFPMGVEPEQSLTPDGSKQIRPLPNQIQENRSSRG